MKKILKSGVILCVIIVVCILASCNTDSKGSYRPVSDYSYNEAEFAAEMGKEKSDNVNFAAHGKLEFEYISYPSVIDFIEKDSDGIPLFKERYKTELKSSVKFFGETLEKITGGSIVATSEYKSNNAIRLELDENLTAITKGQGYKLNISSDLITIASDSIQGISNGIYSFLEDILGCMFLSKDYDYIPYLPTIKLKGGETIDTPDIIWREVFSAETSRKKDFLSDENYLGWHTKLRMNGVAHDGWNSWCHTAFKYLPPEEYFDEHPEYYSLYQGKRTYKQGPVEGQLCWTNEDVYKIISQKIMAEMEENPGKNIWDISQMDTWINRGVGCKCDNCKAIDDEEGSQMGSILAFVNRLADEIKDKFPDNYISTLSYNYSVKPPKNMRPRDNVIIKLCLMPGDTASDYANPDSNSAKDAHDVVSEWGKAADKLLIWDYNVNFHNYLMPYPIFYGIGENQKFYAENNTYGVFHQLANFNGGADAELNSYLLSKALWDNDIDTEKLTAKYMNVYYSDAAKYMSEYYNELQSDVLKSGRKMYIYDTPDMTAIKYFNKNNVKKYFDIFDEALKSAEGNEILTARINKAKIGILYLRSSVFSLDTKSRKAALDELMNICAANGIANVRESGAKSLTEYYDSTMSMIKATPWIITGCVIGVMLIAGIIIIIMRRRNKRKALALSPPDIY